MTAKHPPPPRRVMKADYAYQVETNANFDPYQLIFENGDYAVNTAKGVRRSLANSYRKFNVGAAAVAFNEDSAQASIYAAANWKPNAHAEKKCAEMGAIGGARSDQFDFVVGVFVAGTTDSKKIEEVTGLATPTLHPCKPCRSLLTPETVVFSFGGEDEDVYETYTGKELWEIYQEPSKRDRKKEKNPEFRAFNAANFAVAREIYVEATAEILSEAPEQQTRILRAEAVVRSLLQASAA